MCIRDSHSSVFENRLNTIVRLRNDPSRFKDMWYVMNTLVVSSDAYYSKGDSKNQALKEKPDIRNAQKTKAAVFSASILPTIISYLGNGDEDLRRAVYNMSNTIKSGAIHRAARKTINFSVIDESLVPPEKTTTAKKSSTG